MAVPVDIRQLGAQPVRDSEGERVRGNRAVWLTRYMLPLILTAGFLGTLVYSFKEALLPATPVTVTPVLAMRAEIEQPDAPLFQSAGWVEPRPTAVVVTSLEEGVVEKLFVIEGQALKAGEPVAQLVQADAQLRVRLAEAEVRSREAELASSRVTLTAAETRLQEPLELQTKIAEAEAMLARLESELARLPSQIKGAESRAALATKEKESRSQSSDVVSKLAIARAESELQSAQAAVSELHAQQTALGREHAAQQRRVAGLQRQLVLKVEETRQRDEAKAAVDLAEARLANAEVMLETAKLSLSRTKISAPCDGKVLALVARPGSKVMGLTPTSMPDASTVITMYDPSRLQIRADVRLEDVPRVSTGQKIQIETPAVAGVLEGEVITATSFTDIQKNTLQVKVAVNDPPALLKPDMLVQCTFLSPGKATKASESGTDGFTLLIPAGLVERQGDESFVWVVNRPDKTARRRNVVLGGTAANGLQEVKGGLALGDRLIVSGRERLKEGERIAVADETVAKIPADTTGNQAQPKLKRL